ncbi:MAG TPA: hypothetical protein VD906_04880, partial [Caulobacteraceae bacterium]|nr:hypothetical protein [Caulobacteraceae bacterium]
MPFDIADYSFCATCPHGVCVKYIREDSRRMKDRDTLYRLMQNTGMACSFDQWIPGFGPTPPGPEPTITSYAERVIENARQAGRHLESLTPNRFGDVEAPFVLTAGQVGKVRGDVFEMLARSILWNACASLNRRIDGQPDTKGPECLRNTAPKHRVAVVTLGDSYDLKDLFDDESAETLRTYEDALSAAGTALHYS